MKYILLSAIFLMSGCVRDAKESASGFKNIGNECPKGGTVVIRFSVSSLYNSLDIECRYVKGGV